MDKAAIVTVVSKYDNDPNLNTFGQKLLEATKKAVVKDK